MVKYIIRHRSRSIVIIAGIILMLVCSYASAIIFLDEKFTEAINNEEYEYVLLSMFVSFVIICILGGLGYISFYLLFGDKKYAWEWDEELEMKRMK